MDSRAKPYVFAAVVIGVAFLLWGPKGLVHLLPGPNPK